MRLLIAEDEPDLNEALVTIFKINGYSVDSVFNGQDALDYLELSNNYDGAILDIMMPKLEGTEVIRRLRQEGNSIPVLLLTAKNGINDKVEGLDLGADDYLPKPFDMKELLARVRAMLRRRTSDFPNSIITIGNLTLNRINFDISCEGKKKHLGNKDFQLLELLMMNPERLYSTKYLMDNIWGYDTESDIHAIWTCISELRKKLDSIGANVQIKLKRGQGYYLDTKND
ncbi:MAG: response regulator transcription factor [Bacilli bacterium]